MPARVLHHLDEFHSAMKEPTVLLFKHSPICPISAVARAEYDTLHAAMPAMPTLLVDVIEDRAVARGIADICGVRHESPQAILFERGRVVWHASHAAITRAALLAACTRPA